ncbi:hypothetical protein LRD18_02300 [Halorhodospira halochloris]|uniref:hypothetical protein n=1 Tax=Halorhodospira halochloris TaxID=1052 RepID=UPI001EE9280E|nr:hypothetical protein [Halorhodospira halochloris]MCG5529706.1 hypothetical protein [Halorhodospira halochloris]
MSGKTHLSPTKSYRLLQYLNRRHAALERLLLAAAAYAGCLAVTGRPGLARHLSREFWSDSFKDGLRRAYWYASRGWPGLGSPDSDPFFCFSDGLPLSESRNLARWVNRRAHRLPPRIAALNRLTAQAQVVHQAALEHNQRLAASTLAAFLDDADRLLERLKTDRAHVQTPAPPGNAGISSANNSLSGDFARDDAEVTLQDIAGLLPLNAWGWTALSGTFLGLFREGDFLAHDFDIDLGLPAQDTDLGRMRNILKNSGRFESVHTEYQYRLRVSPAGIRITSVPVLVKAVHRTGIAVDFSLLHQEEGVWWHGSKAHRWDHTPQEFVDYRLRGIRILGPRDGDRYLTECYGDWRTPVRNFTCSSGRRNLVVVHNLMGVCLFLTRLLWHLSNGDTVGYDAVQRQMLRQRLLLRGDHHGLVRMNRHWFDD